MRLVASFLDRIKLLGAAKGATAAAEATVTTVDADHNALDVKAQGTTATSNAAVDVATGLADNATVPTRAVQIGGVSKDTEPTLVSTGRLAFSWVRRNGALMVGALGRNATAIASATNGVPVYPEDSSEWTAKQGTAAAVNAPWYVRLSDGASGVSAATEAKQDTGNTSLASILAKIIAAPSTAAAQTDGTQVAIAKGAAAAGAAVSGNPVYCAGVDGSGNARGILVSAAGIQQSCPARGTSYSSAAAEASKAYNSPQYPCRVRMFNGNAAVRYHVHFNATSLPANGAIPVAEQVCAASGTGEMLFPIPTDRYGTGLVTANSTTASTLTIGSADSLFWIDFFPASA